MPSMPTDAWLETAQSLGKAVTIRYLGPANRRELVISDTTYVWQDTAGRMTDVEAADLEAILTMPGDEFEIVDETIAPDGSRGGHDASTR